MNIYLSGIDAICDLHKKGYTNDFVISGNDLLWVQEKIFMRVGDFEIVECHKITNLKENCDQCIVLGVYALWHNIKGILVSHDQSNTDNTPPVVKKKLTELYIHAGISANR